MGQAKLRGTREQRQAEAIERREADEQRIQEERMAKWKAMSPTKRQKALRTAQLMVALESMRE